MSNPLERELEMLIGEWGDQRLCPPKGEEGYERGYCHALDYCAGMLREVLNKYENGCPNDD